MSGCDTQNPQTTIPVSKEVETAGPLEHTSPIRHPRREPCQQVSRAQPRMQYAVREFQTASPVKRNAFSLEEEYVRVGEHLSAPRLLHWRHWEQCLERCLN